MSIGFILVCNWSCCYYHFYLFIFVLYSLISSGSDNREHYISGNKIYAVELVVTMPRHLDVLWTVLVALIDGGDATFFSMVRVI